MQRITITLPDSLAEHLRSMGWLDAPEFVLKTPQNQTRHQSNWLVLLILRWLRSRVQPRPSSSPLSPAEFATRFSGTFTEADATDMNQFIQEDCRKIDHDNW
ncbi:MAG: hypothetical protein MH825_06690 [Cyanobacteria bacterium]|nr:hypothetical protein [Cyanobacteriota bacterium]